jgi:DNA polymerase I-like protein with 3'-5' exonuclease and polymerase domains
VEPPPLEELVESHPKYPDHRGPRKQKREFAKTFAHATDYLGRPRTVAAATGRTVHEIDRAQKVYLGTYKKIAEWQKRVIDQVTRHRFVENVFGYRWYIFDRIDDSVMPEAVAWGPQSVVSIVINRIWMQIFQDTKELNLEPEYLWERMHQPQTNEVLLQVHDSLVGQFPTHRKEECLARIKELSEVVIPYDDPLVIPTGIGTSEVTWGAC